MLYRLAEHLERQRLEVDSAARAPVKAHCVNDQVRRVLELERGEVARRAVGDEDALGNDGSNLSLHFRKWGCVAQILFSNARVPRPVVSHCPTGSNIRVKQDFLMPRYNTHPSQARASAFESYHLAVHGYRILKIGRIRIHGAYSFPTNYCPDSMPDSIYREGNTVGIFLVYRVYQYTYSSSISYTKAAREQQLCRRQSLVT